MVLWVTITVSLSSVVVCLACTFKFLLERVHHSLGVAPPTDKQLEEENRENHALFRFLPIISKRLAWRQLGNFPTPIHQGEITPTEGGNVMKFYVKREDLSSPLYGGNKVRTLQHQIAVCEAKHESAKEGLEILVVGTAGSNQIVATVTHGMQGLNLDVVPAWIEPDLPDLDNSMNMLSTLSFPIKKFETWAAKLKAMKHIINTLFFDENSVILPPGGNNPSGVFGQMSGILELSEQIQKGEMPDPDGIFLALGSSCTVTGIILGIALTRVLNLPVFKQKDFKVHGMPIHHQIAALSRGTSMYHSHWSRHIPLSIRHSIVSTCKELVKLGGPDLTDEAFKVLDQQVEIHDDKDVVGKYGGHSEKSRKLSQSYDKTGRIWAPSDPSKDAPHIWLCGHFCAKAFEVMVQEWRKSGENDNINLLFWQTKSNVQPLGGEDEWSRFIAMPDKIKEWADKGKAESELRPGKVDTKFGNNTDYRIAMTKVT